MCMCGKCSRWTGILVLVIGVLFLLQDLGVWDFWGLSWYTLAFVVAGASMIGMTSCKDCAACCPTAAAPARTTKRK